jgi:hypothetical protein
VVRRRGTGTPATHDATRRQARGLAVDCRPGEFPVPPRGHATYGCSARGARAEARTS